MTAAERTHRAFFDHAIEGIFRTTADGRYLDANPALARIYGYDSPEALIAGLTNIAGQLYVDPRRRGQFQALMQDNDAVTDFVSQIRRRDGEIIWISENARAVRDWADRLVLLRRHGGGRHRTHAGRRGPAPRTHRSGRSQPHQDRVPRRDEPRAENAAQFRAGIFRDAEGRNARPDRQPAYRDYAENIHDSGKRLLAVINNILDVTRLQAGAITLDLRAVESCRSR